MNDGNYMDVKRFSKVTPVTVDAEGSRFNMADKIFSHPWQHKNWTFAVKFANRLKIYYDNISKFIRISIIAQV